MYRDFYLQASNIADMIRSGKYKEYRAAREAESDRLRQGLVSRREQAMQETGPSFEPIQMASSYIEQIRNDAALQELEAMRVKQAEAGFTSGRKKIAGFDELTELIDQTEGKGDYNALFGFSNREGREFGNINVSEMTIAELKEFTDPNGPYAQFVKANNPEGVVATPLGRYQFVGSTMVEIAEQMGLPDDAVFTPEIQDRMFAFKTSQLLKNETDMGRMMSKLRNTWVGFKEVEDETLQRAIERFNSRTYVPPMPRPE